MTPRDGGHVQRRRRAGVTGPLRTCIGCRRVAPPAELARVVRRPDGSLAFDPTGAGRGAWLCAAPPLADANRAEVMVSAACLALAIKRKAFARAFPAPLADGAPQALAGPLRPANRLGDAAGMRDNG